MCMERVCRLLLPTPHTLNRPLPWQKKVTPIDVMRGVQLAMQTHRTCAAVNKEGGAVLATLTRSAVYRK